MTLIDILLLVQMGIMFLFPLLRRILQRNNQNMKNSHDLFTLVNIIFSSTIFALVFSSNIYEETTIELFIINDLVFSIGFSISILQAIFYFVLTTCMMIYLNYLASERHDLNKSVYDYISYFALVMIPFVFSPNFFQLVLVWFILDIILFQYVASITKRIHSDNRLGFRQMLFGFIISNALILTSIILLVRRSHSFNFNLILNDMKVKFFTHNNYFLLLNLLFFIGITIKTSIYPFHAWFRNVNKDNLSWNIPVLSFYIIVSISSLIFSPYNYLIPGISEIISWVGLIISILSIVFALFTGNRGPLLVLLYSAFFSFELFLISFENISLGFHFIIATLLISTSLPIILTNRNRNETTDKLNPIKPHIFATIFFYLTAAISILGLLGIPPINSSILSLIVLYLAQSSPISIVLFIFCFIFLISIGFTCIKLYYEFWKTRKERKSSRGIVLVSLLDLLLILSFVIYPGFSFIDDYPLSLNIPDNALLITLLPLGILFLFIILDFVLIKTIFNEIETKISPFLLNIEHYIHKIYYFDFIYSPIEKFWIQIVFPVLKTTYKYVIKIFFIGIICNNLAKISVFIWKKIKYFILKIVIPKTKSFFANLSSKLRSFEKTSERTQLVYVLLATIFLLLLTYFLFEGGLI